MGAMERVISQMSYDMRRKRYLGKSKKQSRNSQHEIHYREKSASGRQVYMPVIALSGGNAKKVIGILLIAIGVILILTRCFGGSRKDAVKDINEKKVVYETQTSYENFIQDFNIEEEDLKVLLDLSLRYKQDYAHTLGVWAVESYKGGSMAEVKQCLRQYTPESELDDFGMYDAATKLYKQFIYDIRKFPLKIRKGYTYENGWKQSRTYNGNRLHYGIDIMSDTNESGKIEVISMTDGIVENVGWNETGGYRVGVRSPGGAYFYYAHLDDYPSHLQKGDRIDAGDLLGMMGDTGYGTEGTRGKFPVHLHIGIAVKTKDQVEFWINPYALLKYTEDK